MTCDTLNKNSYALGKVYAGMPKASFFTNNVWRECIHYNRLFCVTTLTMNLFHVL